ncbi:hypothetical protein TSOC_008825 [Tetrabaena socialis]|uniref:Uncharacterized protein n=1 Tax=Tetrabaena socialis TaxID=47790 RepID=A0A2J7ZXG9_9CHLO|nr:hypothetical protein TSOC_008825 [Tetrabaena socialis]|eukprot:PNH04967.1 hypothetical protein TSOC_008825 [Tetrabaena socialis]
MLKTPPTWRALLHLCAFAQVGVLFRLSIAKLFAGPCLARNPQGRCVTAPALSRCSGALFADFPANVVGSFIIGLLSSGSALSAALPTADIHPDVGDHHLSFLPADWALQRHGALHLGLRTGLCGSLTTFSSWILQVGVVVMMVGRGLPPAGTGAAGGAGTEWVGALWALYLGVCGPLTALAAGQHAALAAAAALVAARGAAKQLSDAAAAAAVEAADGAEADHHTPPSARQDATAAGLPLAAAAPDPAAAAAAAATPPNGTAHVAIGTSAAAAAPAAAALPPSAASAPVYRYLADAFAAAVLLVLTTVSLVYLIRGDSTSAAADVATTLPTSIPSPAAAAAAYRFWWFAILSGPAGCVLRWYLAPLNAAPASWRLLGGGWGWLQLGTLTANLLACCLNFVAAALLLRLSGRLSVTQVAVLEGLMAGAAGSLSTVSTWVVELQKLSLSPSPSAAYKYGTVSIVAATALGLLVYGLPAWTQP